MAQIATTIKGYLLGFFCLLFFGAVGQLRPKPTDLGERLPTLLPAEAKAFLHVSIGETRIVNTAELPVYMGIAGSNDRVVRPADTILLTYEQRFLLVGFVRWNKQILAQIQLPDQRIGWIKRPDLLHAYTYAVGERAYPSTLRQWMDRALDIRHSVFWWSVLFIAVAWLGLMGMQFLLMRFSQQRIAPAIKQGWLLLPLYQSIWMALLGGICGTSRIFQANALKDYWMYAPQLTYPVGGFFTVFSWWTQWALLVGAALTAVLMIWRLGWQLGRWYALMAVLFALAGWAAGMLFSFVMVLLILLLIFAGGLGALAKRSWKTGAASELHQDGKN
jgi:hypothetical protein